MTQTLKTLLVATCLICLRPVFAAPDGDTDGDVAVAEPRYVTDAEKGLGSKVEFALPIAAHGAVIVAIVVFFRELVLGIDARVEDKYEYEYEYELDYDLAAAGHERYDSNTYQYPKQGYGQYKGSRRGQRRRTSRDTQDSLLTRIVDTIDPVEATFSLLQVNDMSCRRRVVCEVQRSASVVPLIGAFLQQLSTSITGLQEYREAQDAGAALEDCSLLFSECPGDALVDY